MAQNTTFKDLYKPSHDELARQAFVGALKIEVNGRLESELETLYDTRLLPDFIQCNGRKPKDRSEAIPLFEREHLYRAWGSLNRQSQDFMWDAVGETVERLKSDYESKAKEIQNSDKQLGSMELAPDLKIPSPIADVDIHRQPGGYFHEGSIRDSYAS